MAEVFKNARYALTTSNSTIYTCPAGTSAIVVLAQIANIDGTDEALADLHWTDASAGAAATNLLKAAPIPAGSALQGIGGKLVLEAGDSLRGKASANGDLVITVSVLEIS